MVTRRARCSRRTQKGRALVGKFDRDKVVLSALHRSKDNLGFFTLVGPPGWLDIADVHIGVFFNR